MVLAIECDGASYHAAPTARDRDRLRQDQLETLGWSFHRIWSTDWFHHQEAEVAKVIQAYQQAVADADEDDATPSALGSAGGAGLLGQWKVIRRISSLSGSGISTLACFPRIAPATWANDGPLETATNRSAPVACGPNMDQAWRDGSALRSGSDR